MKLLNHNFNLNQFYDNLNTAGNCVLLCDYDGTLSPFHIDRMKAFPYPGIQQILNEIIAADHTRVAIISGRRAKIARDLLQLEIQPEIWGSHGCERMLPDGTFREPVLSEIEKEGLTKVKIWAINSGLADIIEEKPAGIAFHWRGLDDDRAEMIEYSVRGEWSGSETVNGLKLLDFDCGIEIKAASVNKGRAVDEIISDLDDSAVIAYLGDDLTDEDAFNSLKGRGLSVLVRNELRKTAADLWIQPPHELLDFFRKWADIRKNA